MWCAFHNEGAFLVDCHSQRLIHLAFELGRAFRDHALNGRSIMALVDRNEDDDIADTGLDGGGLKNHGIAIYALIQHLHLNFSGKNRKREQAGNGNGADETEEFILHLLHS
ncbi:hypothetical protein D3C80_1810700 [compost metagenome]